VSDPAGEWQSYNIGTQPQAYELIKIVTPRTVAAARLSPEEPHDDVKLTYSVFGPFFNELSTQMCRVAVMPTTKSCVDLLRRKTVGER
jgi:hypothetical protein